LVVSPRFDRAYRYRDGVATALKIKKGIAPNATVEGSQGGCGFAPVPAFLCGLGSSKKKMSHYAYQQYDREGKTLRAWTNMRGNLPIDAAEIADDRLRYYRDPSVYPEPLRQWMNGDVFDVARSVPPLFVLPKDGGIAFFDASGKQVNSMIYQAPYFDDVIEPYMAIERSNAWRFQIGRFLVKRDGKYGYLDESGAEVISAQFYEASDFVGDFAEVRQQAGKTGGIIDLNGAWVLPPMDRWDTHTLRAVSRLRPCYEFARATGRQLGSDASGRCPERLSSDGRLFDHAYQCRHVWRFSLQQGATLSTKDTPISVLRAWIAAVPKEPRQDMLFLTVYPLSCYVTGLESSFYEDGGEAGLDAWLAQAESDTAFVAISKLTTIRAQLAAHLAERRTAEYWELAKERSTGMIEMLNEDEKTNLGRDERAKMIADAERNIARLPARHQAYVEVANSWDDLCTGALSTAAIAAWGDTLPFTDGPLKQVS